MIIKHQQMKSIKTLFACYFSASPTIYLFPRTLVSSKPIVRIVLRLGQLYVGHSNGLTNLGPFLVLEGEIIYFSGPRFLLDGIEISGSSVGQTK